MQLEKNVQKMIFIYNRWSQYCRDYHGITQFPEVIALQNGVVQDYLSKRHSELTYESMKSFLKEIGRYNPLKPKVVPEEIWNFINLLYQILKNNINNLPIWKFDGEDTSLIFF